MDFFTSVEFRYVEAAILQAIYDHRERAANWRAKSMQQAYEIFDVLASQHETTAKGLEAGWKIIVAKFTQ
jgi:hypothetical protein